MKDIYSEKRNGIYYFRFRDPDTLEFHTCRSSGLTNKDAAIRWATLEYEKIKAKAGTSSSLFEDWARRFFIDGCPHISRLTNEGKTYAKQTKMDNRRYVEEFLLSDPISKVPLNEIKRSHILELQNRIISRYGRTRTAQRVYGAFHLIIAEAIFQGKIQYNPATGVKKIAYKAIPRKGIPKGDINKFLDPEYWENKTHWKMTLTARYTGMRAGEVIALTWEVIDPKNDIIYVVQNLPASEDEPKDPKWGKKRRTVYPKELKKILESERGEGFVFQENEKPVNYWDWYASVKKARTRSGIWGGIHALRHSANTELAEAGISKELRKAIFGWTNDKTEQGYLHDEMFNLTTIKKAINILTRRS